MGRARCLNLRALALLGSAGLVVSSLTLGSAAQTPKSDGQMAAQDQAAGSALVGNKSAKTYHQADCALIRKLPGRSKVDLARPLASSRAPPASPPPRVGPHPCRWMTTADWVPRSKSRD